MSGTFGFGRYEVRPAQRVLLCDGEPMQLGGRAFDILIALIERRERVVHADELLDVVWPGLAVEANNLSVQISALRKLLGAEAIATVRGRGYRFTAQLIAADARAQAPASSATPLDLEPAGRHATVLLAWYRQGLPPPAEALEQVRGAAGRELCRFGPHVVLAFAQSGEGARAAFTACTAAPEQPGAAQDRFGLVMAEGGAVPLDKAQQALALAARTAPGTVVASADVASALVPGVDAELQDLGEVSVAGALLRLYQLTAPAGQLSICPAPAQSGLRPSIAVLPVESVRGGAEEELLGEALADEIIARLSRLPQLCVVSGLSSRRLRRCGLSLSGIAGCLSAHFLLTGTFRAEGTRLTLQLQLEDVRAGTVVHAMRLDTSAQDAFDPDASVGHAAAREVAAAILRQATERSCTTALPQLDNYALLMAAIGLLHRTGRRDFERARLLLEHLAQRTGCQAVAAAWLAKWHVLQVVQGWSPDAAMDARIARDLVQRALDDGTRDALALAIGGLVHAYLYKDLRTAGGLFDEAREANPSEPLAWLFTATRLAWLGDGVAAESAAEQALCLSPIDPVKSFFDSLAATAMLANANWERAVSLSRQSIRGNRLHASTWRTLAFALVMLERMDEARDAVQQLLAIEPMFSVARFRERFPGRDGPLAEPWAHALQLAGLPA